MQTSDHLKDLRFVAAVAGTGSLSGAARHLGVNHATVFRRIAAVEVRLGVRLFERSRGRYIATPAGEELAHAGTAVEHIATESLRTVAGRDLRPRGIVRLTTTDSLHASYVAPMAERLRRAQPEIVLHVTTSNETHNLSRRDADIAIRPTDKPAEHLIGKRIGPLAMAVYGAATYLRANRGLTDLGAHAWIGLDESLSYHRSLRWLSKVAPATALVYRTSNFSGVQQACASGLGLALLPCFAADADTRLRRVTAPLAELQIDLWLLMHPDLRRTARVAVIFDGLLEQFARVAPLIAGHAKAKTPSAVRRA